MSIELTDETVALAERVLLGRGVPVEGDTIDLAEDVVMAVAPLIEAAAREQVISELHSAWSQSVRAGGAYLHTFEDGLSEAAKIARGQ